MGRGKTICRQAPREAPPHKGHRLVSSPSAPARGGHLPSLRAHFAPAPWQVERQLRLARICRCLDRGCAARQATAQDAGPIRMEVESDPLQGRTQPPHAPCQEVLLGRLYRRWKASGGNPAALALNYRAPVKLRNLRMHFIQAPPSCCGLACVLTTTGYGYLSKVHMQIAEIARAGLREDLHQFRCALFR